MVISHAAVVKPPASVTGLARDLGVDTGFAWRTLDELARSGRERGGNIRARKLRRALAAEVCVVV